MSLFTVFYVVAVVLAVLGLLKLGKKATRITGWYLMFSTNFVVGLTRTIETDQYPVIEVVMGLICLAAVVLFRCGIDIADYLDGDKEASGSKDAPPDQPVA